jgi:tetratricopeptide (TPR) repeat protein
MNRSNSCLLLTILLAVTLNKQTMAGTEPSWTDLQNQGDQAQVNGEVLEASSKFQQAADLAKAKYGIKSPQYLKSIIRLTAMLVLDGKVDRAEPYYKQIMALNLTPGKQGQIDPEVGIWIDDLGDTYFSRRDPKTRENCLKHGYAIKTRLHGSNDNYILRYLDGMYDYYFNSARYAEALPYAMQRLKVIEANKQRGEGGLAYAVTAVANVQFKLKHYRESEAAATRLCDLVKKWGPNHDIELCLLTQLKAYIQLAAGELDRAEKTFQELLKIGSADPKVFNVGRVEGWQGLGSVAEKRHDNALAEQYYRRTMEALRSALGPDTKEQLVPMHSLIVLLKREGKNSEASLLEKKAKAVAAKNSDLVSTIFPAYERE